MKLNPRGAGSEHQGSTRHIIKITLHFRLSTSARERWRGRRVRVNGMQMLLKVKMTPCFIYYTYRVQYRPSRDRETGQARPGQDRTGQDRPGQEELALDSITSHQPDY